MEQLYLMPGEERYTKFQDEDGVLRIHYTYCSLHGKLFKLYPPHKRRSAAAVRRLACDTRPLLYKLKTPPRTRPSEMGRILGGVHSAV